MPTSARTRCQHSHLNREGLELETPHPTHELAVALSPSQLSGAVCTARCTTSSEILCGTLCRTGSSSGCIHLQHRAGTRKAGRCTVPPRYSCVSGVTLPSRALTARCCAPQPTLTEANRTERIRTDSRAPLPVQVQHQPSAGTGELGTDRSKAEDKPVTAPGLEAVPAPAPGTCRQDGTGRDGARLVSSRRARLPRSPRPELSYRERRRRRRGCRGRAGKEPAGAAWPGRAGPGGGGTGRDRDAPGPVGCEAAAGAGGVIKRRGGVNHRAGRRAGRGGTGRRGGSGERGGAGSTG